MRSTLFTLAATTALLLGGLFWTTSAAARPPIRVYGPPVVGPPAVRYYSPYATYPYPYYYGYPYPYTSYYYGYRGGGYVAVPRAGVYVGF
jgi:hypothetical protein